MVSTSRPSTRFLSAMSVQSDEAGDEEGGGGGRAPPSLAEAMAATSVMLSHHLQAKYDSMINAPVSSMNPHGRFLLEAQITTFEHARQEGNALERNPQ